jgi:hypothetical protein
MPQDLFIDAAKGTLKDRYNQRDHLEEEIAVLESLIKTFSGDGPPPRVAKKLAVTKSVTKSVKIRVANGKGYTRDDVVGVALELIGKANGPVKAKLIAKVVEERFGKGNSPVSKHLGNEMGTGTRSRLIRAGHGCFGRATQRDARETEKVLEQARTNAERSKEIARS